MTLEQKVQSMPEGWVDLAKIRAMSLEEVEAEYPELVEAWKVESHSHSFHSSADKEIARLRRTLALAAIPLEVLAAQIREKPYKELSDDFQKRILATVNEVRAVILEGNSGRTE